MLHCVPHLNDQTHQTMHEALYDIVSCLTQCKQEALEGVNIHNQEPTNILKVKGKKTTLTGAKVH